MAIDSELLDVLCRHCSSLGNSFVSQGASRILAQPSNRLLFAKTGRVDQVLGEAESLNAMYKASLAAGHSETLIPTIHAFGKTKNASKAFLVTDFKNLSSGLSNSSQRTLGTKLAEMHANGTSENGMYGFERPTHCGATAQDNTWTASWSDFWTHRRIGDLVKRSGDKELAALEVQLREKVYPLLFNAKAMKNVRPAIIHGDLWSGNAGTDEQSGQPIIFDPSSSYSHNEAELGIMKMFGGFGSDFFNAYHKVIPKAEPYYEERQQMYEAYHHLNHFVIFGGGYRSGTIRIFKKLIAWAEKEGSRAVDGEDDESGKGGGGGGGGGKGGSDTGGASGADAAGAAGDMNSSGLGGLSGGNSSQDTLHDSTSAMSGSKFSTFNQHPYINQPPAEATESQIASTSSFTLDASTPLYQGTFPPATPSQIADYFSQMICYLWFSSGVPGHSMPSTPSRSPISKHVPLQSSPLAPRRLPVNHNANLHSSRSFRPTHAKTSSTGNLYHTGSSTTPHSPEMSRSIQEDLFASAAAATSKMPGNDPMLRRLQPRSRFLRFSREVLSTTQVSTSVITLALIYVHRLKAAHPHLKGREGSEYRLAISSLMLANKILDDNTYLNKTWAEISGMPLIEISKMEVEFWLGLKMELHIGKEDYDQGLYEIQMMANDRNRAILQRDAAIQRAMQEQAAAQNSLWTPYLQPSSSASFDGLTSPYESRLPSPLPPLALQSQMRRSMGHFDAMTSQSHFDTTSSGPQVLPYQVPHSSYDTGSALHNYSMQALPYFSRPSSFTLPPSPLSQSSAGGPSTQQDTIQSGYQINSQAHETLALSPNQRANLPVSYSGDQWPIWNQNSGPSTVDGASSTHQGSIESYEISPTNTSRASIESYTSQRRPSLSTHSTSSLAGLKRDFDKSNIDGTSPKEVNKRFAADSTLIQDLQHYRLSSFEKISSQSSTAEARYALRSRSRAADDAIEVVARGGAQRMAGYTNPSTASPLYPLSSNVLPSQRSIQISRPSSAYQDKAFQHQNHANYHSVFTSALTPISLAAPLTNHAMDMYQPWSGSQAGIAKKVTPLHYYQLAAGEPFGNIGSYLPPSANGRSNFSAARRTSMLSNDPRDSWNKTTTIKASDVLAQAIHPHQTPLSAPSYASDQTVQTKEDLVGSTASNVRDLPPFSLDLHSWPLSNTASSNFLIPYHLLPNQQLTRSHQQQPHVS